MTKELKIKERESLESLLASINIFYLTDIEGLNAKETSDLRRTCHKNDIELKVVKNKLLEKALENQEGKDYSSLIEILKGNTAMMIAEKGNAPAKVIKEFRKKSEKPILKGAYVEEAVYVGDQYLEDLVNLKSKEELVGDIIGLLQSPIRNVVSALQSGGNTISGLVKALEERQTA